MGCAVPANPETATNTVRPAFKYRRIASMCIGSKSMRREGYLLPDLAPGQDADTRPTVAVIVILLAFGGVGPRNGHLENLVSAERPERFGAEREHTRSRIAPCRLPLRTRHRAISQRIAIVL